MLAHAAYLDLCLVYTRGTPVVDILPPLPLVICYADEDYMGNKDKDADSSTPAPRSRVLRRFFDAGPEVAEGHQGHRQRTSHTGIPLFRAIV